ncbi:uroporphyrinogen-III synthase [Fervidibacillus halotolerans]|uniref:Uroporphyrinogen-III synthase n=1 Tax=Fervidibacillus halotolerans TaxID=2980027 RepID=A0A9E8RZF7_9BACI|nr:uroporphyrinogen-III synthase [Fervidibacillus halotolerans]WAA11597.1 uroporphyrinogen-III synthase [Fervidibacillus halotolerans]
MAIRKGTLEGKNCLIMRDPSQANSLIEGLKNYGANPILVPLISFRKRELTKREQMYLQQLSKYDWLVFTSQNGVKFFLEYVEKHHLSIPKQINVAAVGKKTSKYLEERGIRVDFIPKHFTGKTLAEDMKTFIRQGMKICVIKGNLAKSIVRDELNQLGAFVDELIIYETVFPEENRKGLLEKMSQLDDGVLIFTSPSTVEHFWNILSENGKLEQIHGKWIASIGPVTKEALESYGMPVHICPDEFTIEGLIREIHAFFNKK